MNGLVRFWIVVGSLLTSVAALGFLALSFVFPETPLFAVGSGTRLLVVLVGAVALGVIVWSSTVQTDLMTERPRERT